MAVIISLIIYLIVLGLIYWLVMKLPLPAPFGMIIRILFVLLAVLACLSLLGVVKGNYLPVIRL